MTYVTERVETIFVYSGTLAAKPIIVTFKENQVSTGAVAATSATSSPQISVGPSSSSELGVSDQERLSAGAKAGVGVGVAVGACTLALLACFFLYRSRKRKTTHAESTPGWRTPELSGNPMGAKELHNDAMTVKEMSNDTMTPQELPSTLRPRVN